MLDAIASIESRLRRTYIWLHNRRLFERYVVSYGRLFAGFIRTLIGGLWNAEALSREDCDRYPILFYDLKKDGGQMAQLVLALASLRSHNPSQTADLILLAERDRPISVYAALARMFQGRTNLHMVWSREHAQNLLGTLTSVRRSSALLEEVEWDGVASFKPSMIGSLRPRAIYGNGARELLKSIDWASRFMVLSTSRTMPAAIFRQALDGEKFPGWRFIVTGHENEAVLDHPQVTCLVQRGHSLTVQLAVAMEAEAAIGALDCFTVVAAIAGRPVSIQKCALYADVIDTPSLCTFDDKGVDSVRHEIGRLIARCNH